MMVTLPSATRHLAKIMVLPSGKSLPAGWSSGRSRTIVASLFEACNFVSDLIMQSTVLIHRYPFENCRKGLAWRIPLDGHLRNPSCWQWRKPESTRPRQPKGGVQTGSSSSSSSSSSPLSQARKVSMLISPASISAASLRSSSASIASPFASPDRSSSSNCPLSCS